MFRLRSILSVIIVSNLVGSCSTHERIKNENGHYSITKLSEWSYEMKNRSIMMSKSHDFDSLVVTAAIIISPGNSDSSLEDTFEWAKHDLATRLKDFHKINEGYTEINGHRVWWLKLSHTLYEYKYISIRYFMELAPGTPVMIDCSSIDGTFEYFEPDFTAMVFSLRIEN